MAAGTPASLRRETRTERRFALRLLDGFSVDAAALPSGAQRLVAFVALHERPLLRTYVAGSLWLDCAEARAAGNLRSALWRVQRATPGLLEADARSLRLGAGVDVDLRAAERLARAAPGPDLSPAALAHDLLPDWYEDWVLIERERFRLLRLHALEALCEQRAAEGRLAEALDAGLAALAGEPLRESAHRALIRVHLAEGNVAEALRQFRLRRRLLREHLGIEPSERLWELVPVTAR